MKHMENILQNGLTMEKGQLCMSVPSSGIGIYVSQTSATYRSTPDMLMEIVIQLKTHTI